MGVGGLPCAVPRLGGGGGVWGGGGGYVDGQENAGGMSI